MAVCGTKCIYLTTGTIKMLGIHFSYNQKSQRQKNVVKSITNRQYFFKVMENQKYYTREESNNFQNINAI